MQESETMQELMQYPELVEFMQGAQSDPEAAMELMRDDEELLESFQAVVGDFE